MSSKKDMPQQPQGPPPPYPYMPQQPNQYGHPQTLPVYMGQYDAGARFGAGATTNIPPPPPGCAPNAAQMAAAQGYNVTVTKKKGRSDGGFTISD
ncbi:DAZ-associated protein 2 [Lingula anatina]|uniref:DAZ-associated protein 2 n=1 Tax=Lingula anatina TaxID=7574 RepID=A0A1S3IGK5_LINAN|nr:DAZ-associated protein 2 [Lingula anatina]|eukprot:XP_013397395.1 DAZ-associated protein 2 [Lingula anatina]